MKNLISKLAAVALIAFAFVSAPALADDRFSSEQIRYMENFFMGMWKTRVGGFPVLADYQGGELKVFIHTSKVADVVLEDIDPYHEQIVITHTNNKGERDYMLFALDQMGRVWMTAGGAEFILDFVRRLTPDERAQIVTM